MRAGKSICRKPRSRSTKLVAKLGAIAKAGYEERIYVRGDKTTDYGTVMRVMARIQAAGYTKIGLVTLQEQDE